MKPITVQAQAGKVRPPGFKVSAAWVNRLGSPSHQTKMAIRDRNTEKIVVKQHMVPSFQKAFFILARERAAVKSLVKTEKAHPRDTESTEIAESNLNSQRIPKF